MFALIYPAKRVIPASNLYYTSTKKHLKMNKEIGMILPKKRVNTSGVIIIMRISIIYIPPYNNTH